MCLCNRRIRSSNSLCNSGEYIMRSYPERLAFIFLWCLFCLCFEIFLKDYNLNYPWVMLYGFAAGFISNVIAELFLGDEI